MCKKNLKKQPTLCDSYFNWRINMATMWQTYTVSTISQEFVNNVKDRVVGY
jgi:hypothetical protein